MKLLRRWTTTLATSFDWMITQVENHEALVDSAIREMQQAGAKAHAQLKRIRRDGEAMRRKLAELRDKEQAWAARAVSIRESDREKALECVSRRKQAQHEIAALNEQLAKHESFETQLMQDLRVIENRIAELKRRKHAMAARQCRTEAMRAGNLEDVGLINELDEIFERWEHKLDEHEFCLEPRDELETEFVTGEEREDLELELERLAAEGAYTVK